MSMFVSISVPHRYALFMGLCLPSISMFIAILLLFITFSEDTERTRIPRNLIGNKRNQEM